MWLKFAYKYFFKQTLWLYPGGFFIDKPYQLIFNLILSYYLSIWDTDFYIFIKMCLRRPFCFLPRLIPECCTVVENFFLIFGMLHCNRKIFIYCFDLAVWILTSYEEFYSFGSPFVSLFLLSLGTRLFRFDCFSKRFFFLEFSSFRLL
jgi:hypothetical protein